MSQRLYFIVGTSCKLAPAKGAPAKGEGELPLAPTQACANRGAKKEKLIW